MKFNVLAIVFIFLAFTLFKILFINELGNEPEIIFPTLETPAFNFIDLSDGCGGFTDCIEYVGAVIYNIGLGLIFLVLFIVSLIVYIFELFAIIIEANFTGIEGAPWYFNLLLTFPFGFAISVILYKMVRRGSTEN